MTIDPITVVTVTRGRAQLLARAIKSAEVQDYGGRVNHLVIVDDCPATVEFLTKCQRRYSHLTVLFVPRGSGEADGRIRLARLRNYAIARVASPWVAFLDDDNELERNHLRCLMHCATVTGREAVYSHRRLFHRNGAPFLEDCWPWSRTREEGVRRYQELAVLGIVEKGSNVVKDRVDLRPGAQFIMQVDTSEWLIRTEVLRRCPISDVFADDDWANNVTEDDKMLTGLVSARIEFSSSEQPSLKYYLGGYSNRHYAYSNIPRIFAGSPELPFSGSGPTRPADRQNGVCRGGRPPRAPLD